MPAPDYPTSICTLDDAHDFLNIPSADTSNDRKLQMYIDAATRYVEYVSDAVIPTQYVDEIHSGGGPKIVLFNTPILTVDSITEYWSGSTYYTLTESERGDAISPYSFSVDNASAGILTRLWNGWVGDFVGAPGANNIKVTYTAGFAVIPQDLVLAVLMDIQGLYAPTQYGGNLSGDPNLGESWVNNPVNAFPRLASILTSSRRVPAVG